MPYKEMTENILLIAINVYYSFTLFPILANSFDLSLERAGVTG